MAKWVASPDFLNSRSIPSRRPRGKNILNVALLFGVENHSQTTRKLDLFFELKLVGYAERAGAQEKTPAESCVLELEVGRRSTPEPGSLLISLSSQPAGT